MRLFPIFVKNGGHADQFKGGYIGARGEILIPPTFDGVTRFREGFASVQVGPFWGVIDESGLSTIKPFSERQVLFSEHKAVFSKEGKCGVIDQEGKIIVPPQYFIIDDYSEGLAWMASFGAWSDEPSSHGFLDQYGSVKIPCFFDDARGFREGLAAVKLDEKWGFIGSNGSFVISPQFDMAGSFRDGIARVKSGSEWGYIDRVGRFVISPRFSVALDFHNEFAPVRQGSSWGYINRSGDYAIEPTFDRVGQFSEGLARVERSGYAGYIDQSGGLRIEMQFIRGNDFHQGLAFVETAERIGYIDIQGAWVWDAPYLDIGSTLMP